MLKVEENSSYIVYQLPIDIRPIQYWKTGKKLSAEIHERDFRMGAGVWLRCI